MPFIVSRFTSYPLVDRGLGLGKDTAAKVPGGVLNALGRVYYDTAQAAHPMAMGSLLKVAASTQVMFGTDFPFGSAANHLKGLAELGYSPEVLASIHRTNATRLMPQFA